jgi:flotillin
MAKDQARIDKESRTAVAQHNQAAQLAEITAKREVDVQKEQAEQAVSIRRAEREMEVGIANEKSKQVVQEQAKVTAMKQMAVLEVETTRKAEISKQAAEIKANQDKTVAVVAAEQTKEVSVVHAEGDRIATQTRAEGNLFASLKDADGIAARGKAEGEAEQAKLMAPVEAQIKLAEKIASLAEYQKFLIETRQIEANQTVGTAMAAAFEKADIKIVGGGNSLPEGAKGVMGMFNPGGGLNFAGMLSGLASTEEGKALIDRVTGNKGSAPSVEPKA